MLNQRLRQTGAAQYISKKSMKKATYYSDSIVAKIDAVSGDDENAMEESFSGRVGFLIDAAVSIAAQSTPTLTVGEWCALADANNGTCHTFEHGMESVLSGMWHNLFDSSMSNDERFDVDCTALAKRLSKSPIAEQLAVFEIVRKFWKTKHAGITYEEIFTGLGAPGLAVEK